MPIDEVKKVLVLGAGTMGSQISLISARAGYQVTLYDISAEALQTAPVRQRMWVQRAKEMGRMDIGDTEPILARITYTSDSATAARNADLVSESVAERTEVKRQIHATFENLCPAHCILTTNTSSLLASAIDPALKQPEKFAAMHYHSGMVPLVDIMRGSKTSDRTVDVLKRWIRSTGMVPMVMKKEKAGYLYNSLLGAHLRTALSLVAGGYADPEDVDRAWMLVTGLAAGPFGSMDAIGLDVVRDAGENLFDAELTLTVEQLMAIVQAHTKNGELGMKTGKGFYSWPDVEFRKLEFLQGTD